jgi:hypothetical protein
MTERLVYGFGVNDADYKVQIKERKEVDGKIKEVLIWQCPYHQRWKGILDRAYSPKWHKLYPTYVGCSVHEDWRYFSKFKAWMIVQEWEGKHLDKDLLVEGNKIYGPYTCIFLDPHVNLFLHKKTKKKSSWKAGVDFHKGRFRSRGRGSKGENLHLGYFDNEDDAHMEYLKNKSKVAKILAEKQSDKRIAEALMNRYYLGECND